MDADTILNASFEILFRDREKIYVMAQTCGGWEIWLQCELAYVFQEQARREVAVWGDQRACDLYFENDGYIAELKCLGWNVIQTSKKRGGSFGSTNTSLEAFAGRVLDDKAKVQEYNGRGISIAVVPTFIEQDAAKLLNHLKCSHYQVVQPIDGFSIAFWSK